MSRSQNHKLIADDLKEYARAVNDRMHLAFDNFRESFLNLTLGTHRKDKQFLSHRLRRRLHLAKLNWSARSVGIDDKYNPFCMRHEFTEQLQAFWSQIGDEHIHACGI